jgi:hypothetical protein
VGHVDQVLFQRRILKKASGALHPGNREDIAFWWILVLARDIHSMGVAMTTISMARRYAKDSFKTAMDKSISDAEFEKALTAVEKYLRSYRDAARTTQA